MHFQILLMKDFKVQTPNCIINVLIMQAYHRYALNYINALNYLETLRRQPEFTEFEKV